MKKKQMKRKKKRKGIKQNKIKFLSQFHKKTPNIERKQDLSLSCALNEEKG